MFVHTLVKANRRDECGWRTPAELGEATPNYVSFVVPVRSDGRLADDYACEVVKLGKQGRTIEKFELVRGGKSTFKLELPKGFTVWFTIRSDRLPYIGTLKHNDFNYVLAEIEPEEPSELDRLCEQAGMFIIGCDPQNYVGANRLPKK
jgi:hypothetical protein